MRDKQEFSERFWRVCERLGAKNREVVDKWFEVLWANYEETGRAYHTITHHIAHALELLDNYDVPNRDTVELAIWFHDVIYDGKRSDNELKSAEVAERAVWAMDLGSDDTFAGDVWSLIMATTHEGLPGHGHMFAERQCIVDIDLQGLGSQLSEFDDNGERIRKEYAFADEKQYAEGRKKFAQKMLARPSVFAGQHYQRLYEAQAQVNLRHLAGQ